MEKIPPPTTTAAATEYSSSSSPENHRPPPSNMNPPPPAAVPEDPVLSTTWEWGSLFDFDIESPSILPWDSSDDRSASLDPLSISPSLPPPPPSNPKPDRIRKRDPRLICENFLAGRVPCSCPEMDEKEEEEEEEEEDRRNGKKRSRRTIESALTARCQVPGCEADIRELKGYHRRHRVCLRCANASAVVIGGQTMRYCQQCGKFHVLSDFDEGKRSCRRKLERHNNRRRRKSNDAKSVAEKEPDGITSVDAAACNNEVLIDTDVVNGVASTTKNQSMADQLKETETLFESEDGYNSALGSVPSFQNVHSNSPASFVTSCETQIDEGRDYSKATGPSLSSSCYKKCAYSSACPTGRMSFKLYDWNPAEFPRRLRHQIFQWLASMPIELEGYIRPGCTILTLFIAMPQFMWVKLSGNAFSYLSALVNAPESLLSGRSSMRIFLNDMIFQVLKDGTSLMNVKLGPRVPRLHYVHPTCFEAGKPVEFVVCGSNLIQPKLRLLVSFAGKYLVYDSCLIIPEKKTRSCHANCSESTHCSEHEMFKIFIGSTESNLFGPAFIEVENESGLSNFISVLIGDKEICSELDMIQQKFGKALNLENIDSNYNTEVDADPHSCQLFVSKQTATSELLLDIAWLLKAAQLDEKELLFTSMHIKRVNYLLRFLIENDCIISLERILQSLKDVIEAARLANHVSKFNDADLRLFQKLIVQAREILQRKLHLPERTMSQLESSPQMRFLPENDLKHETLYSLANTNQKIDEGVEDGRTEVEAITSQRNDLYVPLVKKETVLDMHHHALIKGFGRPQKACVQFLSSSFRRPRFAILSMAVIAVCFTICAALSHPHAVKWFAVSMRRCLFRSSAS